MEITESRGSFYEINPNYLSLGSSSDFAAPHHLLQVLNMTTLIENSNTGSSNIQYAGFTKRLKAFGFDHLFIFAYIVMLLGVGFGITLTAEPLEDISPLITKKHRTPYDWAAGSYVIVIK